LQWQVWPEGFFCRYCFPPGGMALGRAAVFIRGAAAAGSAAEISEEDSAAAAEISAAAEPPEAGDEKYCEGS
jgi:hypothetical protein